MIVAKIGEPFIIDCRSLRRVTVIIYTMESYYTSTCMLGAMLAGRGQTGDDGRGINFESIDSINLYVAVF